MENDSELSVEDSRLQEMEEKLEGFAIEENDMEDVRDFFKEVRSSHVETREQIGELIRQLL